MRQTPAPGRQPEAALRGYAIPRHARRLTEARRPNASQLPSVRKPARRRDRIQRQRRVSHEVARALEPQLLAIFLDRDPRGALEDARQVPLAHPRTFRQIAQRLASRRVRHEMLLYLM